MRPDPDIKSVRVCKYILARMYRGCVLGGRKSDRDGEDRAHGDVEAEGGIVTVHRYRQYVPKTVNGVRTNPRITAGGGGGGMRPTTFL